MDTLIARLTDLAYEIFGILAPGVLALATLVFFWVWTGDLVPKDTFQTTDSLIQGTYNWLVLGQEIHWSIALVGLIVSYVLGHALKFLAKDPMRLWFTALLQAKRAEAAKSNPPAAEAAKSNPPASEAAKSNPPASEAAKSNPPAAEAAKSNPPAAEAAKSNPPAAEAEENKSAKCCSIAATVWSWLVDKACAPTQPTNSFNEKLRPLLQTLTKVYMAQGKHTGELPWVGFFPMARARIGKSGTKSYLTTFQNSYTFHRSLATLATIAMWAAAVCLAIKQCSNDSADVVGLWFLLIASFGSKQVFAANFRYFWGLWGNQVITEAYALEIERSGSEGLPDFDLLANDGADGDK